MTDENDARARDSATRNTRIDDEVVEAELVEDEQSSAGPDSPENGDAEQVERDLDELQDQRRPQTPQHEQQPQTSPPDLERERDEYLELARRTKADFENYRKRVSRDASEALARGKAELARELLPVIDNLERALEAPSSEDDALAKGVSMVLDELRAKLAAAGVESFDPTGERFDPQLHEALSTQPAEGTEAGTVIETVEKGYRLNGQVLRAARVVVSQ
jgi:molecular chaperone GrpE